MQKIETILNWNFNPRVFKKHGDKIITDETKQHFSNCEESLKELTERLPDGIKPPDIQSIKSVYWQFQKNKDIEYADLLNLFFKRDIRILIWALEYRDKEHPILFSKEFKLAIDLIQDNWRDSFILSLWRILMDNWIGLLDYEDHRNLLTYVLSDKCKSYNQNRKEILSIASNIHLFVKHESPREYAKLLLKKGIPVSEAHSLLNLKESVLHNEYYSVVIEKYVDELFLKNVEEKDLVAIYNFLKVHKSKRASLLVCSSLINNKTLKGYGNIIKDQSLKIIGDPHVLSEWKYAGLTTEQKNNIEAARKELQRLLNKAFIKVFFEKLVEKTDRKRYWLNFIDKIDDVKFCGNKSNYHYLKNIEDVSKYVDTRYRITKHNQDTCALIMYSRNFVFVEFSDSGALYIYKRQNFNKVNLNAIISMADLKLTPSDEYACKNSWCQGEYDTLSEGKINHQGDWQKRVRIWMREYYD